MEANQVTVEVELEQVDCDLCGSIDAEPLVTTYDRNWPFHSDQENEVSSTHEWSLVRCKECGLVYLNPRPANVGEFYPNTYYSYVSSGSVWASGLKSRIKKFLRRRRLLWNLLERTPWRGRLQDGATELLGWVKPGTVLEIGCGSGDALGSFAALGWKTFGVEISEAAAELARRKGHTVWVGDVATLDLPEGFADAVYMSHVLEHTPSPRRTLTALRRLLRPGGVVIIEVPNFGALWSKVFRECNVALDLPRHFYHFTRETLVKLVSEAGFRVKDLKTRATPRYFLQSLLLSYLDRDAAPGTDEARAKGLLMEPSLFQSLQPFCQALEQLGQGNHLRMLAASSK